MISICKKSVNVALSIRPIWTICLEPQFCVCTHVFKNTLPATALKITFCTGITCRRGDLQLSALAPLVASSLGDLAEFMGSIFSVTGNLSQNIYVQYSSRGGIQRLYLSPEQPFPPMPNFRLLLFQTYDGRIHFDANLFWTSALLYKHFNTTGIESWDAQVLPRLFFGVA